MLRGRGTVSARQLLDVKEVLFGSDEVTRAITYLLVDFEDVAEVEAGEDEVRAIAERDRRAGVVNPGMIIAVVALKDLHYGLSRMWEIMLESAPMETQVFRSRPEAEAWIVSKLGATGA
ncbi:hypothetical protein [Engelhardtia mirabilis]|uniref:hypothetical protein n=1 Tax=Engelhardtia mirabilis TaxID=2528011 RepID=UPI003AF3FD2D